MQEDTLVPFTTGESNIIAKVVVPGQSPDCPTGKIDKQLCYAKAVKYNDGVSCSSKILGAPDGHVAQLYDTHDKIKVSFGKTLKAGSTIVVSWKSRYYNSSYSGPSKMLVKGSLDGHNYFYLATLETYRKEFLVQDFFELTQDVKYIKIYNPDQRPDFEVDAITNFSQKCVLPTICRLVDHGGSDQDAQIDRMMWMNYDNKGIQEYTVSNGKLTQFPDGTALLTGRIENIFDPCDQWQYLVRLVNESDWNQWVAQGKDAKTNGNYGDKTTWTYWDVDDSKSFFYGEECNAGKSLNISQNPGNREFGFQLGDGAGLKGSEYSLSGWYNFSGDFTGHGDFNGNIDNCKRYTGSHLPGRQSMGRFERKRCSGYGRTWYPGCYRKIRRNQLSWNERVRTDPDGYERNVPVWSFIPGHL